MKWWFHNCIYFNQKEKEKTIEYLVRGNRKSQTLQRMLTPAWYLILPLSFAEVHLCSAPVLCIYFFGLLILKNVRYHHMSEIVSFQMVLTISYHIINCYILSHDAMLHFVIWYNVMLLDAWFVVDFIWFIRG